MHRFRYKLNLKKIEMKTGKVIIQIVLALTIIVLCYVLVNEIAKPVRFAQTKNSRESAIIERLKDIRTAQRAYKQVHQKYTGSFDTLVNFVLTESLPFKKSIGSKDDSLAVAKGLVKEEVFYVPVIDTIFSPKKLLPEQIRSFEFIPHGLNNAKFYLDAGMFTTESKVVVPVFEARAPYKLYLGDLDPQELRNLVDDREKLDKYPGLKVGALDKATNDEGNWE